MSTRHLRATLHPDKDAVLVTVHGVFDDSALRTCLDVLARTGIRPRERSPDRMFHVGFDPGVTLQQAMAAVKSILQEGGFHVTVGR